jgi:hypothetical protein
MLPVLGHWRSLTENKKEDERLCPFVGANKSIFSLLVERPRGDKRVAKGRQIKYALCAY